MAYELQGVIHKVFPTETKTNDFKTRDFVVRTEEQYPQYIKFNLTAENCGLVEYIPEGSEVKVFFNLRGREWEGKYFLNAAAWRIIVLRPGNNPISSDAEISDAEVVDDKDDAPF